MRRKQTDKAKVKWRKSATGFLLNNQHLPHTFVRKLSHCTNSLFSTPKCEAQATKFKLDLKDIKEEHEEEEEEEEEEVGLLVVVVASFVA